VKTANNERTSACTNVYTTFSAACAKNKQRNQTAIFGLFKVCNAPKIQGPNTFAGGLLSLPAPKSSVAGTHSHTCAGEMDCFMKKKYFHLKFAAVY
jgi:hypothetical protein